MENTFILPVKEVYEILVSELEGLTEDNTFMNRVPEDYQKKEILPISRISEISSIHTDYASNLANGMVMAIQVDIWTAKLVDIETYYLKIDKLMARYGWSTTVSFHDTDPDFDNTNRLVKRYKKTRQISLI